VVSKSEVVPRRKELPNLWEKILAMKDWNMDSFEGVSSLSCEKQRLKTPLDFFDGVPIFAMSVQKLNFGDRA